MFRRVAKMGEKLLTKLSQIPQADTVEIISFTIIIVFIAAVLVVAIIACSGCCCTNKKRRTTRVQPKAEVWNGTRSLYPNALLYHLDDSIKCNEKKCGLQSGIKLNTGHFFYISLKGLQLCTIIFTNIVLRRVWSQRNQTTTQATYWYQRPLHYS